MQHLPPRYITVHASATYPSMDIGVKEIREWHTQRGFNDVGYHYVIRRDGTIEEGRPLHIVGAHVGNNNTGNIGICMVGGVKEGNINKPEDNFTHKQYSTLTSLITEFAERWPYVELKGHNDFPGYESRGCPCFNQHVYFKWLESAWKSKFKPVDWADNSKYDWHRTSLLAWEVPKSFYDEIDFKR